MRSLNKKILSFPLLILVPITQLPACVLLEDAFSVFYLIQQAPISDDYIYRTRSSFLEEVYIPLTMLQNPPLLAHCINTTGRHEIQSKIENVQSTCREFIDALTASNQDFNQSTHDIGVLSLHLQQFIHTTYLLYLWQTNNK